MMASLPSAPLPTPRATLTDLPKELLRLILLNVDRPSAIALARTARTLTQTAETRIWSEVDLSLNPHHGEYPLIRPYVRTTARPGHEWSIETAKAAEERHRDAIREKVKDVIRKADDRRCGLVERVRMVPRPGAVAGMLTFLDLVGTKLTTLEIDSPTPHPFDRHWRPHDHEILDLKLVDARLHLPALTYLRLGRGSIRFKEIIPFLCSHAPNLVSLDVHLDQDQDSSWSPALPLVHPPLKIRELYIIYPNPDELDDEDYAQPIVWLLASCQTIHRVSIRYEGPGADVTGSLADALRALPTLQELDCRVGSADLVQEDDQGFPSLQRVLYKAVEWESTSAVYPTVPSLRAMYFGPRASGPLCITQASRTKNCQMAAIPPIVATEFRAMPLLHVMHVLQHEIEPGPQLWTYLDELEASGDANGYINSVRYGDKELLFCCFYSQYIATSNHPLSEHPLSLPSGTIVRRYIHEDGTEWETAFYRAPEAYRDLITDFEGETVPPEVIDEMRRVDGKSEAEWRGRGISVGEEAWKVLTDWHEGVLAERAEGARSETPTECPSSRPAIVQKLGAAGSPDGEPEWMLGLRDGWWRRE